MAIITTDYGSGGAGLTPQGQGVPSLAQALRDVADDVALLAGASGPPISSPNATDLASALTLVNEIKAYINADKSGLLKTKKG